MFRSTVNVGGLPAGVIVLIFGIVGTLLGWLFMRRALTIEPETHNFRATAPDRPNWLLRAGLGLGLAALALAVIALPR